MRGIPHNPVDGTKYSGLFQGVPVVLEYDSDTGGYKLVVDVEGSLDVNMTGVTVAIGAVDTELPDAAALGDSDANPTAPAVGAFTMAYDEAAETWHRVRGGAVGEPQDLGEWSPTMRVGALAFGVGDDGQGYRLRVDPGINLRVTMISGSFPAGAAVDTELPAAAALADGMANPTAPAVGGFMMGYNEDDDTWERLRANPAISEISPTLASPALITFAIAAGLQQSDNTVQPLPGRAIDGLFVTMVSGSFPAGAAVDTELPAAAALADGMANPSAPAVASHLMGYKGDGTWDRLYMGASGSLAVDLITALEANTDEVTAYVTGTVSLESGKTIQRAVINVSGSGGEQTLVAAAGGSLKIKVLEVMLISDAAVKAFFQSGFTGTALTGPMSLPADGDGFFLNSPANRDLHHFETAANQALVLDMSAAAAIGGWINYYTEA